jgi:hypothetical protein
VGEQKLILKPGINSQYTKTLNSGSYSDSQAVRFHDDVPEKIGGWESICQFSGIPRALHAWSDLMGVTRLASGSNIALEIYIYGQVYPITPYVNSTTISGAVTTVAGSTEVTITFPSHGATNGGSIYISVYTGVGGLTLYGAYTITSIVDSNRFTITSPIAATTSVTNGGTPPSFNTLVGTSLVSGSLANNPFIPGYALNFLSTTVGGLTISGPYISTQGGDGGSSFQFIANAIATSSAGAFENGGACTCNILLPPGPSSTTQLIGWGTGTYGIGTYGESTSTGVLTIPLRLWSLDNYGQNLIANPQNLGIYQYVPTSSIPPANAAQLTNAPLYSITIFTAMPQQQVVALGTEVLGAQDFLLIRWSDAGNNTVWTASASNQAGSYRLSNGSRIVGGRQTGQQALIWTDIGVWAMQYVGLPFVYSFTELAKGCGLISMRAQTVLNQVNFWMSQTKFCMFDGASVLDLYCPVWDFIFKNLDTLQQDKITAAANSRFNEVSWFFPSLSGGGEVDSYVTYNPGNKTWVTGQLVRTAWIDQSVLGGPIGTNESGWALQHEIGYDSVIDGTTTAIPASIETGFIDIRDGSEYMVIDQLIPDFVLSDSAVVKMYVKVRNYPGGQITTFGPYPVVQGTELIPGIRARGREMAIRLEITNLGGFFRGGASRYRSAPDGSR